MKSDGDFDVVSAEEQEVDIEKNRDEQPVDTQIHPVNPEKLKLDSHGLPLVPQPSSHPSDPLNFPQWLKIVILIEVSIMALLGPLNSAIVNAAYVPMGIHFHISSVTASYQLAIAVASAGLGSFLFVPLANVYGRRPVYLVTALVAAATGLASGKAPTWGTLLVSRVINGLATSSFFTLGAPTAADLFFLHERGRAIGIFTVCLTNSGHISPIPGGFLAQFIGYAWCYYFAGILTLVMFFVMLFGMPETIPLHPRSPQLLQSEDDIYFRHPILARMRLWTPAEYRRNLQMSEFARPFQMLQYPSIVFPAIYYGFIFMCGSILPAATVAILFNRLYKFDASQVGLALGLSSFIGSSCGEFFGGPIIDLIVLRIRKRSGGLAAPEVRLGGIWPGVVLLPTGMMIFGFCIHFTTAWPGPTIGIGIMCFAVQVISTVVYSYCTECYKPQTGESSQVLNFSRQTFGMTVGFWAVPLGDAIGWEWFAVFLVLLGFVIFAPIVWLMWRGEAVRERLGTPKFHPEL